MIHNFIENPEGFGAESHLLQLSCNAKGIIVELMNLHIVFTKIASTI